MEKDGVAQNMQVLVSEIEHLARKLTGKKIQLDATMVLAGWYEEMDSREG